MSAPACIDICALRDEKYLILKDGGIVKIRSLQDELPTDDSWSKLHKLYQDGDHYTVNIWPKSLSYPLPRVAEPDSYANKLRVRFYVVHRDCNPCNHNVIQSHKDLVYRDHNPCNQSDKEFKAHDPLECMLRDNQNIRKRKLIDCYRGGDFYLSKGSEFYVVFKESNTFLQTSSLFQHPEVDIQPQKIHKELCNGLYYFATAQFIYVVIADTDNNLVYCRTPDLQSVDEDEPGAFPVHPSVAEVLRNGVLLQRRSWTNGIPLLSLYYLLHTYKHNL